MGTGSSWSDREIALAIEDYFAMLVAEIKGRPYRKADHFRALGARLDGRTKGSIERKHQNISAILIGQGIGPIDGYKPLGNYQTRLAVLLLDYLDHHPRILEHLRKLSDEIPATVPKANKIHTSLIVDPPEHVQPIPSPRQPRSTPFVARIDFAERDQQNRKLGRLGEQFVLDFERNRLLGEGRDDLVRRIDWVAQSKGDGLGYDIISFDDKTDSERLIEVKTTNQGFRAPFYITSNELRASEEHQVEFRLYRVFRFSRDPKLFILNSPLSSSCELEPKVFRANF